MASFKPHGFAPRPNTPRPFVPPLARLPDAENGEICNVWSSNLEEQIRNLQQIIQKYKYVAIDTEFPGVVVKPQNGYRTSNQLAYRTLKCNADCLKMIQLGMTFFDDNGQTPKEQYRHSTWQFNFKYDLDVDLYAHESIDLLKNSGILFERHRDDGIEHTQFAEFLISSGVVLMDDVKFIAFHACYDFAYLVKTLTNDALPATEKEFFEILKLYFPTIYDVEYLTKKINWIHGGLQAVADQLGMNRVGASHQAGSDALLTGNVFFRLLDVSFHNILNDKQVSGNICGLHLSYADIDSD